MSMLIDLDDISALEKLGQALCKIPSVVVSLTKSMMENTESRKIILDHVKTSFESPEFKQNVEKVLLTSELKTIQRIASLENVTGLTDFSDFEEEEDHIATLPEQITILSEKIESLSESTGTLIKAPDNIPIGKTEIRACKLIDHLRKARETVGNKFLSSNDIVNFLKNGLDEALRVQEGQNVRQVKKEVLEKAVKMFPGQVFISQKSTGRKNLRIALKT